MAKDRDVRAMIKRVNFTMDKLEKILENKLLDESIDEGEYNELTVQAEKDRIAYKEGLVDGICMYSWNGFE